MTLKITKSTCLSQFINKTWLSVKFMCLLVHRGSHHGNKSFIHAFIQLVFIEHLLYSKYFSRGWTYRIVAFFFNGRGLCCMKHIL